MAHTQILRVMTRRFMGNMNAVIVAGAIALIAGGALFVGFLFKFLLGI
jgi:hypothetical protein